MTDTYHCPWCVSLFATGAALIEHQKLAHPVRYVQSTHPLLQPAPDMSLGGGLTSEDDRYDSGENEDP
jgi:hypothetical protein